MNADSLPGDQPNLISIIVPCFNQGRYLPACLNSVRGQSFTNWECIIVDDGSTDSTREVAAAYCREDHRFRYHFQQNRGLSGARNAGIGLAKGAYLNFLDSDDSLESRALELLRNEFNNDPQLVLAYSGYTATKHDLDTIIKTAVFDFDARKESFFLRLCSGGMLPVHSALVKKEIIREIGVFDESLKSCEDWDFWLRLARVTNQVAVVKIPLVRYRMTASSMTRNVSTYFDAGITVIHRTTGPDPRVSAHFVLHPEGSRANLPFLIKNWYCKCIGMAVSQKNTELSRRLVLQYHQETGNHLDAPDLLSAWKWVLYGAVMLRERKKAWHTYQLHFVELIKYAEEIFETELADEVRARIRRHNASLVERVFFRLTKEFQSLTG